MYLFRYFSMIVLIRFSKHDYSQVVHCILSDKDNKLKRSPLFLIW